MSLSDLSGHSESLGALANLASGSSERQIQIYKAQVTRKTVALLGDEDVDVRRSAAALLMNLAPHAKIKERIVEAQALKPLAKALKDSDEILNERAAGALANLFNDHSANVHAGFQQAPEMIPSLVSLIQTPGLSEDAKRQGAHALAMLAAEDGPCDAVWQAGAGPPLLVLLKDMIGEAALGIMNLSWRWPQVKAELVKSGTLEYLMDMLKHGDDLAKEYAAGALMNMTAGSPDNAEKATAAVKDLSELLKSPAVQAAEWAAGALANITRSGQAAQETAIENGAATSIAALLPKVTANGMSLVVLALASLAETQANSVSKALGAEAKAKLRDFRDSNNSDLQEYTKTLVDKLGPGFSLWNTLKHGETWWNMLWNHRWTTWISKEACRASVKLTSFQGLAVRTCQTNFQHTFSKHELWYVIAYLLTSRNQSDWHKSSSQSAQQKTQDTWKIFDWHKTATFFASYTGFRATHSMPYILTISPLDVWWALTEDHMGCLVFLMF